MLHITMRCIFGFEPRILKHIFNTRLMSNGWTILRKHQTRYRPTKYCMTRRWKGLAANTNLKGNMSIAAAILHLPHTNVFLLFFRVITCVLLDLVQYHMAHTYGQIAVERGRIQGRDSEICFWMGPKAQIFRVIRRIRSRYYYHQEF